LSWWELSLYIYRYELFIEREKGREEQAWARFRLQWADFRNANRGKGKAVKPQDLIELSFDKKEKDLKIMSQKDKVMMFGSKFDKLNGN